MASHGVLRSTSTQVRSEEARQRELDRIQEYRDLVALIQAKIADRQYTAEVFALTTKLLKRNPEYYTIWNVRRRLLIHSWSSNSSEPSSSLRAASPSSQSNTPIASTDISSSSSYISSADSSEIQLDQDSQTRGKSGESHDKVLGDIRADLSFLIPLLMEYPKCYWIWNYRLWLLQQANKRLEVPVARQLWQEELGLVSKMLVLDNRNFHGWGYRRTIIGQLESKELEGESMVEAEFAYTTKMIQANLSNFSAWHYRSKLIRQLMDARKADDTARRQFLDDELDLIKTALWTDPFDQSIWFYHQFLMSTILEPEANYSFVPNLRGTARAMYIGQQLDELKEMLDGEEGCKWLYHSLLEYTMVLWRMQAKPPQSQELQDTRGWLEKLRVLDPLRGGRWDELERKMISGIFDILNGDMRSEILMI